MTHFTTRSLDQKVHKKLKNSATYHSKDSQFWELRIYVCTTALLKFQKYVNAKCDFLCLETKLKCFMRLWPFNQQKRIPVTIILWLGTRIFRAAIFSAYYVYTTAAVQYEPFPPLCVCHQFCSFCTSLDAKAKLFEVLLFLRRNNRHDSSLSLTSPLQLFRFNLLLLRCNP